MYKKILLLLTIGIIFFMSGLYYGHEKGISKGANVIVSSYDEAISIMLKNEIKLLKLLKSGEVESAKNTLETLVDTDVSYLGAKFLKNSTIEKDVLETLREVKAYRLKYPDHKPNAVLSKTIEETFQKISKQP